jgi:hypothetical protein
VRSRERLNGHGAPPGAAPLRRRLPGGKWRLAEVKSTVRVKIEHLDDLAVQAYVIEGSGLTVSEMHLVHVDTSYVRGNDGMDWQRYFKREDVTIEIRDILPFVPGCIAEMHAVMALPQAPKIRPSGHCFSPHPCEFWPRCTADKPADWIFHIPRLSQGAFAKLDAANIQSMRDIPPGFRLSPAQRRVVDTMRSGREFIADGLREALVPLEPPASYLDFETFSPTLPIYAGTSPNERIPFQWSLHYDDRRHGDIRHCGFLAAGDADPRREFAKTLLHALEGTTGPIVVYSSFEASVLRDLAGWFTDLLPRLFAVINRIRDLLPIIRKHVSHPEFLGSYSIKAVAPALVPGFTYADLADVAGGDDASIVFHRLATDQSLPIEDRNRFRRALLTYCGRDTAALVSVHRKLRAFVDLADHYAGKQSDSESHLSMPSRQRRTHGWP